LEKSKERKNEKMNILMEWIAVGAGLAIGKLLVAVAVIAIGLIPLIIFFILEEKTK
jgi:hypothetical protein